MTTIVTRLTKGSPLTWIEADANFTNLNTDKAPVDSPNLTGVPTAPTATNGTNTTQLATTAFVQAKTATQTPSTAIGNIVATNVQAALEELDTEKASLTGATFSGQVTATKLQTGVSGTNTNNFILDASAADGTMKLERGDGQDIMTVDAAGKVVMPQNAANAIIEAPPQTMGWGADSTFSGWTGSANKATFVAADGKVTPQVAGIYMVSGQVNFTSDGVTNADTSIGARLRKNGAVVAQQMAGTPAGAYPTFNVSVQVYLNGTTDYVQIVGRKTQSPNATNVSATLQITLIQAQ